MSTETVVRVDPKTLLVGANVRKQVELDKEFVTSIKETGVLTPITAYQGAEGLVVVDGQRRTLAAVDLGLESVPVWVTEAPSEQERILEQVVVNERRSSLSLEDGIAAVQELALFDVKVPAIAKVTGLDRKFVEQAVSVGQSKAAQKAIKEKQLSFDTAVLIAEFDEHPDEQKQLLELDQHWQVREAAKQFRTARQKKAVEDALRVAGVKVIKEPDYHQSDPLPITYLYTDAELTKPLEAVPHEKLVKLAGDGLCGYSYGTWESGEYVQAAAYAVAGWQARGLFTHAHRMRKAAEAPEDAERVKEQRRVARERTKGWKETLERRVEFLQGLVARKTMPKGWEPLVAARMLENSGSYSTSQLRMILAILKLKEDGDSWSLRSVIEKHLAKAPTRAPQIMLAIELGCVEGGYEFDRKGWDQKETKGYLERLMSWGYELSEAELLVVGKKAAKK